MFIFVYLIFFFQRFNDTRNKIVFQPDKDTKPFSAKELLARVRTQLNLADIRQQTIEKLEKLNQIMMDREERIVELKDELKNIKSELAVKSEKTNVP